MADTEEPKQKCSSCSRQRPVSSFVGKKGGPVRRCIKCREKDARQKARPEVRVKKNKLQREKQYYKDYRARKRAEDEAAFLAHNAEVMRARLNRKPSARLKNIKEGAARRGYVFELSDARCEDMLTSACFYCGVAPEDRLNGIDRMDNTVGYMETNVVPCCGVLWPPGRYRRRPPGQRNGLHDDQLRTVLRAVQLCKEGAEGR